MMRLVLGGRLYRKKYIPIGIERDLVWIATGRGELLRIVGGGPVVYTLCDVYRHIFNIFFIKNKIYLSSLHLLSCV